MGDLLSREEILTRRALRYERVDVPEWGGAVCVRELTSDELDAYQASLIRRRRLPGGRVEAEPSYEHSSARLASLALCDAAGERLFTDAQAAELGRASAAALDRVCKAAMRLSRMTPADREDLEKNSATTGPGDSGSV